MFNFAAAVTLLAAGAVADPTPVVIWHGMGDSCCNPESMGYIKKTIEENVEGVYVLSLRIGDSVVQDTKNGFLMNVNKQVSLVCEQLAADPKLKDGYHAIGFSQGGQFLRAVEMAKLLDKGAYISWIQNSLVQAEYWHDPIHEEEYKEKSVFLADINNENGNKHEYKANLIKLENFVLVQFTEDTMVYPRESEWFWWFKPGDLKTMVPMNQTALYTEDRIGMKTLDEAGKLHFIGIKGNHLQITAEELINQLIKPYLSS